eukprot:COSAG02_NODE_27168_length_615_cov_2.013566_1_plen_65_part_01
MGPWAALCVCGCLLLLPLDGSAAEDTEVEALQGAPIPPVGDALWNSSGAAVNVTNVTNTTMGAGA